MVVRNYCKIISAMLQYYDYGVLLCFEQVLIFQRCIQKYLQRRWYAASGERVVVVQTVKNPPTTRETRVQSLGREDFVEQGMATHSSILAWRIPWTEEPGGLQSMGSLRVGHDWASSLSLFTFMHWRRKWQPTPVFLPGESQGWEAWWAAVYGVAESDTTEVT